VATPVQRGAGPSFLRCRTCVEHGLNAKDAFLTQQLSCDTEFTSTVFFRYLTPDCYRCALITNMSDECKKRAREKPKDKNDRQVTSIMEKTKVLYKLDTE
jgi:hypothetical protein